MKNRVIWKMFALTLLTLGIYRLYWFVKTRKEIIKLNPKIKIISPVYFFIPLFIVVLSVVLLMMTSIQSAANRPSYCNQNYQSGTLDNKEVTPCEDYQPIWPLLFLYFSFVVVWPLVFIWLWSYSKAVEVITKGKTSFAMSLLVLLAVPDGIDILIIQDGFNKLSAKA